MWLIGEGQNTPNTDPFPTFSTFPTFLVDNVLALVSAC